MKFGLKQIAELAEVSISAVSMVLRDYPVRVSKDKIDLIKKIAKENNYTPNSVAVSLVNQKTNTIGVIVPDIENVFFSSLVKKIGDIIRSRGYAMLLYEGKKTNELEQLDLLSRGSVDAIIFAFSFDVLNENSNKVFDKINSLEIPHVALDTHLAQLNCPCVGIDHREGSILAMQYLLNLGHKKIAFLAGVEGSYSTRKRLEGYCYMLEKNGIEVDKKLIKNGQYRFDIGYKKGLESLQEDITAIFASNDMMAYGVIKAAYELGKKIPQDISLIGYDDIVFSSMTNIPLTTIRQPINEVAKITCDKILEALASPKKPQINEIFKVEPALIVRESAREL